MHTKELIDAAKLIAGNYSAVGRAIGASPQQVHDWQAGRAPCPLECQALLAAMIGIDPMGQVAAAMLESNEGKPRGEKLKAMFQTTKGPYKGPSEVGGEGRIRTHQITRHQPASMHASHSKYGRRRAWPATISYSDRYRTSQRNQPPRQAS